MNGHHELDRRQFLAQVGAAAGATAFFADGGGRNKLRLAFCYPTPEFIREGIRRLSTVINGELELLTTFSQTAPLATLPPESIMINPPANLG